VGPGEYLEDSTVRCGTLYGESTICIDKAISVISTHGAAATVVRGMGDNVIGIAAAGVVLGAPGHGFTVLGDTDNTGIEAEADRVRIEGNMLARCFWGIELRGSDHYVARNLALQNELTGFSIHGSGRVRFNTASGNAVGGFYLSAGPSAPQLVTGNVAVENGECGFCLDTYLSNAAVRLIRNAAITNEVGIRVEGEGSNAEVTRNNTYGNWTNCGLQAHFGAVFSAPRNFFGAASGPGSDPADEVCNALEGNASAPSEPGQTERAGAVPAHCLPWQRSAVAAAGLENDRGWVFRIGETREF
jgi:hypothetical protein